MFALYKETVVLAFKRAVAAWPVAFSLLAYALVFMLAAQLVSGLGLGLIGGLLLSFVGAACASGYLYLLSQAVQGLKLRFTDFKRGFVVLFWDVVSVMFALWIISFGVDVLLARPAGHNGPAISAMAALAMAFFLNPVPEMIYLGQTRSFQLLLQSARFVLANPVAWFIPNLLFALALLAPLGALSVGHPGELLLVFSQIFSPGGVAAVFMAMPVWAMPLVLLFIHYVMVFRGLLFQGLSDGGARRRQWQASQRA